MATHEERLGANKAADCLMVLFIPSVDRDENPIDQDSWVTAALKMLGALFTGGTAFPQGRGVWRDDSRGGLLIFDEPTLIAVKWAFGHKHIGGDACHADVMHQGRHDRELQLRLPLGIIQQQARQHLRCRQAMSRRKARGIDRRGIQEPQGLLVFRFADNRIRNRLQRRQTDGLD